MDPADRSEGPESPAQPRPKRSRTGCLTCRTRRRKCDEAKPTCQNCISKSLSCQYPATFQFLGKNNFTPEVATNVQYTNLRFVAAAEEKSAQDSSEVEESQKTPSQHAHTSPSTVDSQKNEAVESEAGHIEIETSQGGGSKTASTDNYEFALHGLLALGNAHEHIASDRVGIVSPTDPFVNGSPELRRDEDTSTFTRPSQDASKNEGGQDSNETIHAWQSIDMPEHIEQELLPPARVLELLKHYRYDIAPWLDIGDASQSFGCEALQISTESVSVHYSVLALAEKSLELRQPYDRGDGTLDLALLADSLQQREYESGTMSYALMRVLGVVRRTITNLENQWMPDNINEYKEELDAKLLAFIDTSTLASSIYWLWTRLQLSVALATAGPMTAYFDIAPATSPIRSQTRSQPELLRESRNAIAMCLEIFIFCYDDEDKRVEYRYGQNRVEAWTSMVHILEHSYASRSTSLKPIIELYPRDGRHSDDEFPTIVFTSGAAILFNQLYHTGMLLLLQNKPRFATQRSSSSPFMSILWHARRICGIAVNNDRRECWDPCLLSSFFVAARTTTHQSQHAAILDALANIERLTCWRFQNHVNTLREEWRLAEGW